MKKFFLLLIVLLFSFDLSAQFKSIMVTRNDGSSLNISTLTQVSVEFVDNDLVFISYKGKISIPASEVSNWSFSDLDGDDKLWSSGIRELKSSVPSIFYDSHRINISGLSSGSPISIFSLNGVQMFSTKADAEGCCIISTDSFTSGIYILKYQNHSLKFNFTR